jgi:hypothetical protein
MLNKRNEPIPKENAISLTNAFQRFIQDRFPNLWDLERDAEGSLCSVSTFEIVKGSDQVDRWQLREPPPTPEINKYDAALRQAELSFREWANTDGPKAYVLDPKTGEWRQIDTDGGGWLSGCNFLPGIHEDFVSPDDMNLQGPSDAQFDGILSKVFFNISEFEATLRGSVRGRRGAKPRYDWSAAQSKARELMEYNGPFSPDDPDWDCQAQLEKEMTKYFEELLGPDAVPSESTIRSRVSEWLSSPAFKDLVVSSDSTKGSTDRTPKADN